MKICDEVKLILETQVDIEGNLLRLTGQFDRKQYVAVNKVLENLGGKWNRKEKAHIFSSNPKGILEDVLDKGEFIDKKKELQLFETPQWLAEKMVTIALADVDNTGPDCCSILEPSAGRGRIVDQIIAKGLLPDIVEKDENLFQELEDKYGYVMFVMCHDFMDFGNHQYDRIVMNPPFTKQQDIDHVNHAYDLLVDGGRVVAIMSPGFTFRTNKKSVEFKKLVEEKGWYEELPEKTFKESGTNIKTVLVVLDK